MRKLSKCSLMLWLATTAASSAPAATQTPSSNLKRASNNKTALRRTLQETNSNNGVPPLGHELWGVQSGPANGHSDAGGMIYDHKRDELILVGTTHDAQFFADDGAAGIDCFIVSVPLPSPTAELSAAQLDGSAPIVGMVAASHEAGQWKFGTKHRIATTKEQDRCDLIARIEQDEEFNTERKSHQHTFVGGTMAIARNSNNVATAVEPMIYEATIDYESLDGQAQIGASSPLKVFREEEGLDDTGSSSSNNPQMTPNQNDIIIPAMMTTHHHALYVATIHRLLVVSQASSTAEPMMRIALGLTKLTATDNEDASALEEVWSRTFSTSILEVKGDSPSVTSGMFHGDPGMSPAEQSQMEIEQEEIEQEINQIEQEQAQYEEEQMHFDFHRHEYKHDGVLISGLEVIDVEDNGENPYILVAGSAPGTQESRGVNTNRTMSNHPFMDTAHTFVGDWDGFVAKVDTRTGNVLKPVDTDTQTIVHNTWSFRLQTQPKRNDYVQSICVPRFPPGTLTDVDYYPSVAYVIGTTQGIVDGEKNGGAFILQLDLDTMNILWKQQIPGMNVHGMSCQVLVDVESHGTTTRSNSKDLLYIAGEVHGEMTVEILDGQEEGKTETVVTKPHGETDIWVAQLRASDGKVNWVQQVGTPQQDRLAKNSNNPSLSEGKQESNIGETGSGKGALVIDKHGHALVYGTSNGPLIRTKKTGESNRDIFVLRLHRDDGSYQSIISTASSTTSTPAKTHASAEQDVSINYIIVGLGLAIPVFLGIIIIIATTGNSSASMHSAPTEQTDLHLDFPSRPVPPEHESAPSHAAAKPPPGDVFVP